MRPVALRTNRLLLDQPTLDDAEQITLYCQDPLFERYLTTPWPYTDKHSREFIVDHVPSGWASDDEYTWAVRLDGELIGMVGFRTRRGDIGFWVGEPHRGNGYMTEAVGAVADWLFHQGVEQVEWFCVAGNQASASVAHKSGFSYTGERLSPHAHRGGVEVAAWFGVLLAGDSRDPKPGWPAVS